VSIRGGMAPGVGRVQMAWERSDVRAARRAITWGQRVERWAAGWEQLVDRVAYWSAVTEIGGVSLATRLGITLHPSPLPTEPGEPDGSKA
jgi:hypothetical protein